MIVEISSHLLLFLLVEWGACVINYHIFLCMVEDKKVALLIFLKYATFSVVSVISCFFLN